MLPRDRSDDVTPPGTAVPTLRPGRIVDEPAVLLKGARNCLQADVYLVEGAAGTPPFVRKDMRARPWLVRATWARWLTAREGRALARLEGAGCAPRLLRAEGAVLEMERVAGERLPRRAAGGGLDAALLGEVAGAVAAMHARGVAHGDLRRTNILVDRATGGVRLIDFGTAWIGGPGSGWMGRLMFPVVRRIDEATLRRLLAACARDGGARGPAEAREAYPWYLRAGHLARRWVYRPLKRLLVPSRRPSRRGPR